MKNPAKVLHTAGMLEVMQQRWGEAAARFEQAVSLDESFVGGYAALARTRAEQGRFAEAHAALDWAARLGIDAAQLAAARRHVADLQAAARVRREASKAVTRRGHPARAGLACAIAFIGASTSYAGQDDSAQHHLVRRACGSVRD